MFKEDSLIDNNFEQIEFSDELYNKIKTCFNIYEKAEPTTKNKNTIVYLL